MFENPRRGRQARNFTTNVPKILGLKSSSEQIFSENCRWVPLVIIMSASVQSQDQPMPNLNSHLSSLFISYRSGGEKLIKYHAIMIMFGAHDHS